jgi:hypothetical protein
VWQHPGAGGAKGFKAAPKHLSIWGVLVAEWRPEIAQQMGKSQHHFLRTGFYGLTSSVVRRRYHHDENNETGSVATTGNDDYSKS